MKEYELTIIVPEDTQYGNIYELDGVLRKHSPEITRYEDDGVKRLCYPIKTNGREYDRGRYLYRELRLEQGEPQKLADELNINGLVLRYLLVQKDTRRATTP